MVQNSSSSGNGLNPGAWAGVGIGAAGCIFVFCMWIFRWSKRSRDNIIRGEDAVGKVKAAFGIGAHQHSKKRAQHQPRKQETKLARTGVKADRDEEMGDVKMPAPVARGVP